MLNINLKTQVIFLLLYLPLLVLAAKPDIFLLKTYEGKQDLAGWVMSEKLDGVRGFWNGQQLLTRGGNKINTPDWFLAQYPPFAIDGELWIGRGDFEKISSIVRRKTPDERWHSIKHYIFEVPHQAGNLLQRLAVLEGFLAKNPQAPIRIIKQIPIENKQHLKNFLTQITLHNGEGVVVRDPKKTYQTGRLNSALKVKKYQDDECVVQNILLGKGKYLGKMGSLLCKRSNGQLIKIGTGFNHQERENPPLIGTTITFKYYGLTKNGKPKYATFLRLKQ